MTDSAASSSPTATARGPRRCVGALAIALFALLLALIPGGTSAAPVPVTLGYEGTLESIACPSSAQCTAISNGGDEWTFHPRSPGAPEPVTIDTPPPEPVSGLPGSLEHVTVVCPATNQCRVVDSDGREVTFNPLSPGHPQPIAIDSGDTGQDEGNELSYGQAPLSCPSTQQCTAVNYAGQEVTFNPLSPGKPTAVSVDSGARLRLLSCPSTEQCTAADTQGHVVSFDPLSPVTPAPVTISSQQLTSLACPSAEMCVAVDEPGRVVTFDPLLPGQVVQSRIRGTMAATGLACPSASQCTAVGEEEYVTFDPGTPSTLVSIRLPDIAALTAVACPSVSQCTAVEMLGGEETFDPTLPSVAGASLSGIAMRHARLSFTLTAGTSTAPLKEIVISLPSGLSLAGPRRDLAHDVVIKGGHRRLPFTASAEHNRLAIALRAPASQAQVTVLSPVLAVSRTLAHNATTERLKTLAVGVTATSTQDTTTPATLRFNLAAGRPLRLGIPPGVRAKLLKIATRTAASNGDPHPYDIEAVRTTEWLIGHIGHHGANPPSNGPQAFFIAMRGRFRCRHCTHPPGTSIAPGSVITLQVPAPLGQRGVSGFGLESHYPDLRKLGVPVGLDPTDARRATKAAG